MALSPDDKYLYLNTDPTAGEADLSKYYPIKYLRGVECLNAAAVTFSFRGPNNTTSTRVTIVITSGFVKEFFTQLINEINFGDKASITLAVKNLSVSTSEGGSDFVYVNATIGAIVIDDDSVGFEDLQVAEDLDVGGRVTTADLTVTNDLSVTHGGTGVSTLTANGVLFGNGTLDISAVDLSSNGNVIVGGATPAVVTGANLAGSGLAATTGNGTLVLAVETLNQDTTGNAATATKLAATKTIGGVAFDGSTNINLPGVNTAGNQATSGLAATATLAADATTLATPRAINGVDFDGSAAITVTAAGSTLSNTVTVAKGGTGLTTVAANKILTGNGTSALTAEANLEFGVNRLTIGNNSEDIQPYIRIFNDENTLELGVSNAAGDFVSGSADGDAVINCFGDHNLILGQNDQPALTIDTDGDVVIANSLKASDRTFAITGNTDGTHEGDVVYFGGTTSMTVGTIYHYKSDGTWEAADADAVATSDGLLGVALGAASDANGMLLRGMVTLDHDPGAVGDVLFLSTTAGDATSTAPSGNNDIVRVIGYCLHASNGQIWFNPDSTFVEVTA